METDIILGAARKIEEDARKWCYHLGNHAGGVSVDELRDAVSLIRDLAQTVAELATRVGDPQAHIAVLSANSVKV